MDDRFEQEFYRSPWQRVLPVGPDGIQPFVRLGGPPARVAGRQDRLAAMLRVLARGLSEIKEGLGAFGAFGRWERRGIPSAGPPSVRPLPGAPRTAAGSVPRPRLSEAA